MGVIPQLLFAVFTDNLPPITGDFTGDNTVVPIDFLRDGTCRITDTTSRFNSHSDRKAKAQVETAQESNHRNGSYTKTVNSGYGAVEVLSLIHI